MSNNVRVRWTDEMLQALLEALYAQLQVGKATDGGGFKAEAWSAVVEAMVPSEIVIEVV